MESRMLDNYYSVCRLRHARIHQTIKKELLKYEKDFFCSCFFAPSNLSWRL